mmetsp:Transcript_7804/g.11084  ORF Transcript_7804/g.11084 Transcript_7804/m.11084 type:complete len:136 (+) Transcript_7804:562-969(+)
MTLDNLAIDQKRGPTYVGSMLFHRCVSGPRVVAKGVKKAVCGTEFSGYGSHIEAYPHSYLVMACAIGMTKTDIEEFVRRLEKVIKEVQKEQKRVKGCKEEQEKKAISHDTSASAVSKIKNSQIAEDGNNKSEKDF